MQLPAEFVELDDFYYVPFWKHPWFLAMAIVVGAILLTLMTWALLRFVRARRVAHTLLPYEWALAELACIQPNGTTLSKDERRAFYGQLTFILKWYITYQMNMSVLHCTDEELARVLLERFAAALVTSLLALLQRAELVKFAPDEPAEVMQADWQAVRAFIEHTKPAPEVPNSPR